MSAIRVRLARLAQRDVIDATAWYEKQVQGLGTRFVTAVDGVLASLSEQPRRFPVVHDQTRRALVDRFPYGVYFVLADDYVRVVAIVHLKRGAAAWLRRL